jgi:hypothetical protein
MFRIGPGREISVAIRALHRRTEHVMFQKPLRGRKWEEAAERPAAERPATERPARDERVPDQYLMPRSPGA